MNPGTAVEVELDRGRWVAVDLAADADDDDLVETLMTDLSEEIDVLFINLLHFDAIEIGYWFERWIWIWEEWLKEIEDEIAKRGLNFRVLFVLWAVLLDGPLTVQTTNNARKKVTISKGFFFCGTTEFIFFYFFIYLICFIWFFIDF